MTVGNNALLSGANVAAANDLTTTIGGNLTVESLQDTYYSKGNSWDASVSVGIGTGKAPGSNSYGAGYSQGNDTTDMAPVNLPPQNVGVGRALYTTSAQAL
jgi:filamentous hemagglutinin